MAVSAVSTAASSSEIPSQRIALFAAVWLVAVVAAYAALLDYKGRPGPVAHPAPTTWPASSQLPRSSGHPTLLMFVHPQCSCSHASIAELARLLASAGDDVETIVAFAVPPGTTDAFASTELWQRAASIRGVHTVRDRGNEEADRFGVATSGHALLYGADGALLFSGGITNARGHEGASAGQDRLASLLRTGAADRHDSAVFGCTLDEEEGQR